MAPDCAPTLHRQVNQMPSKLYSNSLIAQDKHVYPRCYLFREISNARVWCTRGETAIRLISWLIRSFQIDLLHSKTNKTLLSHTDFINYSCNGNRVSKIQSYHLLFLYTLKRSEAEQLSLLWRAGFSKKSILPYASSDVTVLIKHHIVNDKY